jgi:CRISPR-associated protein Cas1
MKRPYYIFSHGTLKRKENTIFFLPATDQTDTTITALSDGVAQDLQESIDEESIELGLDTEEVPNHPGRRAIPVADIDGFYVFGEVSFNTRFMNFLTKNRIPMHLFNYYGYYSGTYYPRDYLLSGYLLVHQATHYQQSKKRMVIAREFIRAAAFNILKNLKHYAADSRQPNEPKNPEAAKQSHEIAGVQAELKAVIESIEQYRDALDAAGDVPTLMGLEGNIRQQYYAAWGLMLRSDEESFQLTGRVKNPPNNAINALISFGNGLMYSQCLTELYRTQLNPTLSFLHEPSERRFSLSLDLAEVFKPIFVDRVIFKLINNGELKAKHFTQRLNFCHLNDAGRKIFVKAFEEKLTTTIRHRTLERSVSYRRLVRLECYKLIKHLLGESEYEAFRIWW